jgi:hypothetical protein
MFNFPKPVTPHEAKRVWDSQRRPSARAVAKALTQAGRPVHFATVARWKRQGWRTVATDQHPIEAATTALDAAMPLLTGDPTTMVKGFVDASQSAKVLQEMTDEQLQARTVREANIALIIISEAISCQCEDLMRNKTGELAVLLKALAALRRSLWAVTDKIRDKPRPADRR